ncbi:hypothetical protein HDV05_008367 [Chytridiales sp. JEL 0842]|nr:hypothetical protein HDV05_008367 [Chytridiales sp. JEL 0842]
MPAKSNCLIGRRHLIELHEQPWCPSFIRDDITKYLLFFWNLPFPAFAAKKLGYQKPYEAAASTLYEKVIEPLQQQNPSMKIRIFDMCSGAGGPVPSVTEYIAEKNKKTDKAAQVEVVLSDYYPNVQVMKAINQKNSGTGSETTSLSYYPTSIDATNIPSSLNAKVRTLHGSFHHFQPSLARRILKDAVDKKSYIFIAEGTSRSLPVILSIAVLAPFIAFWQQFTFIRPTSFLHLFTALFVVPHILFFDGLVSCLRTYSEREFFDLVDAIPNARSTFDWEYIEKPMFNVPILDRFAFVTMYVGKPKEM